LACGMLSACDCLPPRHGLGVTVQRRRNAFAIAVEK
jgi:hypothetical protein